MGMNYAKLFELMKKKGLSSYKIRKEKIISERSLQALRENGSVTTDTLGNLCRILNCQPCDIMEYIPD